MTRVLLVVIAILVVFVPTQSLADAKAAEAAIAEAEARYAASVEAGFAWTNTRRYIDAAIQSLAAGDADTALAQAARARKLADASLEQARLESEAWKGRFPS